MSDRRIEATQYVLDGSWTCRRWRSHVSWLVRDAIAFLPQCPAASAGPEHWRRQLAAHLRDQVREQRFGNPVIIFILLNVVVPIVVRLVIEWWFMPRGSGKALALDTPLVTPFGWTTMGEVQLGDFLFDEDGWPCRVIAATEIARGHKCYRVTFSDGESIVCDAEHLWTVEDRWSRRNPLTLKTEDMRLVRYRWVWPGRGRRIGRRISYRGAPEGFVSGILQLR